MSNDQQFLIYRFKDLQKIFKISRSTIDKWEAKGEFPKRIQLGKNSVGWNAAEIKKWFEKKCNPVSG